ncbi:MAG: diguanylate cyclase (GGDEF)-like protein [Motiliproteus sp.]|jgi:diguanylate cyclase (GGDEF)-like protein
MQTPNLGDGGSTVRAQSRFFLRGLKYTPLLCALCFVAVAALGCYWTYMSHAQVLHERQQLIIDIVHVQAAVIERSLARSLSATRILALEVEQRGGLFDDFESYAQTILDSVGGVSNLQLAPDGIVLKIHPLSGNEKAIGHNILKDDERRKEALQALQQGQLVLAGPFELVQGGIAVIGRMPVFLAHTGQLRFWGFASALIHLDELLAATDLARLEARGYSYELQRIHPDSDQRETFAHSSTPLGPLQHHQQIAVPNAAWTLLLSRPPVNSWTAAGGYLASILIALLAAGMLRYLLRQPQILHKKVRQKTKELQSLQQLAFYDHLTGLANRRLLNEHLQQLLREVNRYTRSGALLYLDLDDFKQVNDSMGHHAGDQLLKQIAQRLRSAVRDSDLVARLGGDEFGVLLLDPQSVADVRCIAEELIRHIELPISIEDSTFRVSTSIGISLIPQDGDTPSTLLSNADSAMYRAKRVGKHNYRFYAEPLEDPLKDSNEH